MTSYLFVTSHEAGTTFVARQLEQLHQVGLPEGASYLALEPIEGSETDMGLTCLLTRISADQTVFTKSLVPSPSWSEFRRERGTGLWSDEALAFGNKAFVLRAALFAQGFSCPEWVIWLDADVEFTAVPDLSFLDERADVAVPLRKWAKYPECGFVAYNMGRHGGKVIDKVHSGYVNYWLEALDWGYDCSVLARALREVVIPSAPFERQRARVQDLTEHLEPEGELLDIWDQTPLARWSNHHKGRRKEAYLSKRDEPG